MKNKLHFRAFKEITIVSKLILCCLLISNKLDAQVWHVPKTMDLTFANNVIGNNILDCANITYVTNTGGSGQLGVISWDRATLGAGAMPYGGFMVFDNAGHNVLVGGTAATYNNCRDFAVVIGNGVTNALPHVADYRVALAYTNPTGQVYIDVYDITGYGTAGLTATFVSSSLIGVIGPFDHTRIDLIEETSVTTVPNSFAIVVNTPGLLPNCSRFVLTYATHGGGVIYAWMGDLNSPGTPIASTSFMPSPGTSFYQPDVAAIQIPALAGFAPCGVGLPAHDLVYINFIDNNGALWGAEWIPASPVGCAAGATTVRLGVTPPAGYKYYEPRVDGYDDYNTIPGNYYTLAVNYVNTSVPSYDVHIFNSSTGAGKTPISLNANWGITRNWAACVINGPGDQYWVGCITESNNSNFVIGAVDNARVPGPGAGALSGDIYQINNDGVKGFLWATGTGAPNNPGQPMYPAAISSSVNDQSTILAAYENELSTYWYKFTAMPIAFKPGTNKAISNSSGDIRIGPNPATDRIIVSGIDNASYVITDITGKELLIGNISANAQSVDISSLPRTICIITLTDKDGHIIDRTKFVKQ